MEIMAGYMLCMDDSWTPSLNSEMKMLNKQPLERPSKGRYTYKSNVTADTDKRQALMKGQGRMETALLQDEGCCKSNIRHST
jgi:hypothetical protein